MNLHLSLLQVNTKDTLCTRLTERMLSGLLPESSIKVTFLNFSFHLKDTKNQESSHAISTTTKLSILFSKMTQTSIPKGHITQLLRHPLCVLCSDGFHRQNGVTAQRRRRRFGTINWKDFTQQDTSSDLTSLVVHHRGCISFFCDILLIFSQYKTFLQKPRVIAKNCGNTF